ncbi:MAG: hypothetical protein ACOYXC_16280 [Candidatus Rifleibacteriota bacterium]
MFRVFEIDCFDEACKTLVRAHRFFGTAFAISLIIMAITAVSTPSLKEKALEQFNLYWLLTAFCLPVIFRAARFFLLKAKIVKIGSFRNCDHDFLNEQLENYRRISFAILAMQTVLLIFAILAFPGWPFYSISLCLFTGIAQQLTRPDYNNWNSHQVEKREYHQDFFKH